MNLWFTDEVSNYSKKCVKVGHTERKFETREAVVCEVNEKILNFIERWKKKQDLSMSLNGNILYSPFSLQFVTFTSICNLYLYV